MPLLSAGQLTNLRALTEAGFPDTAAVWTRASVSDSMGGETHTYSASGTSYACRLVPQQVQGEIEEGGRIVSALMWKVLLPYNASLNLTDRLRINSRDYEVLAQDSGQSERIQLTVLCRRVD